MACRKNFEHFVTSLVTSFMVKYTSYTPGSPGGYCEFSRARPSVRPSVIPFSQDLLITFF